MKEQKFNLADMLADVSNLNTQEQIEYLSIDDILPDPKNFYQLSGIPELMANIELIGLQQPIRVRPHPEQEGKYIIISGHRRHAACKLLAEENERFRLLPCIVERQEESDSLRQLRLIYANANTRTMTSAEVSQQVEQVEQLLYQLKEEGYEFPGRMRDHVAEACKVSTGKIARLKVIRSGLIPQFMRLWETDKLRESVAYTLAGLTPVRQKAIWIAQTDDGKRGFPCTDGWVQNISKEMDRMRSIGTKTKCPIKKTAECNHAPVREDRASRLGQYYSMPCTGCCCSCYSLVDCHYSCEYAGKEKLARKNERKEKAAAERAEQHAKDEPKRELMRSVYERVKELRDERGVSINDFAAAMGETYGPYKDKYAKYERDGKIDLTMRMPGGIWPDDVQKLIAVADLLGCSLDYLFGRSDTRCEPAAQTETPLRWRSGEPPKDGRYIVVERDEYGDMIDDCRFEDGKWRLAGLGNNATVVKWLPMPEDEK